MAKKSREKGDLPSCTYPLLIEGVRLIGGPLNRGFTVLCIIRNSQRRTQTPLKSLKRPILGQKDDYIPQVR